MSSLLQWIVLRIPRTAGRSANSLISWSNEKASSWWDHPHLTRRLATRHDAEEFKDLPAEQRYVLLQAARFRSHYYIGNIPGTGPDNRHFGCAV